MSEPRSLPELLYRQAARRGGGLALRHKALGLWHRVSWEEYAESVRKVAASLLAFGLRHQENVAVLGENRPEWLYTSLGIMAAGGATCGIYPTSSPEQILYLLDHSGARVIFVENEEQLEKVLPILPQTKVERMIVWDPKGLWGFRDPRVVLHEDFEKEGDALRAAEPGRLDEALARVSPDATAMIIYTSGTTGNPKGAMLGHGNALFMADALVQAYGAREDDELISYLPLAHIYENLGSVLLHLQVGFVVNFVESLDTLFQNLREVSPTYFASVPRIWEKLASTIELRMADSTLLKRALYRLALRVGKRWYEAREAGKVGPGLRVARFLTYWAVFEPLKRRIGFDRARLAFSGAAPASPELFAYFQALGVPLVEGYGMTESTGVIAVNRPDRPIVGTVGEPIPGIEVTLAEDGEILARGPLVFKGYYRDPEQT
ncbi:MAG TPA: AMP-binding protein, partial [Anaeromyxobacteraceae bacterium]|nr:AMP-binding protein [Anaeromyxobacteraceae bacterium]